MTGRRSILIAALVCALTAAGASARPPAHRPTAYRHIATMTGPEIPNGPLWAGDLGWVAGGRFYFADASNARVDVFAVRSLRFVGAVRGFTGIAPGPPTEQSIAVSGPTGITTVGRTVWAGNGDGTVKVIDPRTLRVIHVIRTGAHKRADEMAWDPRRDLVLVGAPSERRPFAALIDARTRRVVARIVPSGATGIEQPIWDAGRGVFYLPVPLAKGGEILAVSPTRRRIAGRIPLRCEPSGMVQGPNQQILVSCTSTTIIVDVTRGHVLARFPSLAGGDQVAYDPVLRVYFATAFAFSPAAEVGVIDARSRRVLVKIPTSLPTHALAVDPRTHRLFVPEAKGIAVFAPVF